jgi:GNAT superfamily N-acetyltransferase
VIGPIGTLDLVTVSGDARAHDEPNPRYTTPRPKPVEGGTLGLEPGGGGWACLASLPGVQFRIQPVSAADTWELRRDVLRPHQRPDEMALADDDDPSTASFAAFDDGGLIVGTGRVGLDPPPSPLGGQLPDGQSAWRLRGMATREDARHAGIGSAVLGQIISRVGEHGGGLLWCNARVPAVNLYRRAGFVEHGPIWDDPDIGPHVVMWRTVAPLGPS